MDEEKNVNPKWYKNPFVTTVLLAVAVIVLLMASYRGIKTQGTVATSPAVTKTAAKKAVPSARIPSSEAPAVLHKVEGTPLKETKSFQIRRLTEEEEGQHPSEIGDNLYGFASGAMIVHEVRYKTGKLVLSERRQGNAFEIQKIKNQYFLIGFVPNESPVLPQKGGAQESFSLKILSRKSEDAPTPVAIPFSSITEVRPVIILPGYYQGIEILTSRLIWDTLPHD